MKKRLLASLVCLVLLVGSLTVGLAAAKLKYGDSGNAVVQLQNRLRALAYYSDTVDGKYGYSTYVAVRNFQTKNGLVADGVVGDATFTKLYSATAIPNVGSTPVTPEVRIQFGQTGPGVVQVQTKLWELKYYTGAVDGKFGHSTVTAVRDFQQANGLKVDGIVGKATWAKLHDGAAVPKPAATDLPTPAPGDMGFRLVYGAKNNLVLKVQERLKALGYYGGNLDSTFGYTTKQAVDAFQRRNNLKADGVVGPITWAKMMDAGAIPAPVAPPGATPVPVIPEVPAPATLKLMMGSTGLQVQQLQQKLIDLKYYGGPLDGKYGYSTVNAVRAFQAANKLAKVDGVVGPATWNKLFDGSAIEKPAATPVPDVPSLDPTDPKPTPTPTPVPAIRVQYGQKGALVKQLQERLRDTGYYTGPIDSSFGYSTYRAVRSFQSHNNLKVDGIVGKQTWDRLMSPNPIHKP